MNKNFGKEPVYYDLAGANNSSDQMMRYLGQHGLFRIEGNSHGVNESEEKRRKSPIMSTPPSPIPSAKSTMSLTIALVQELHHARQCRVFPLKEGDIYNAYLLDEQREIITERLKELGLLLLQPRPHLLRGGQQLSEPHLGHHHATEKERFGIQTLSDPRHQHLPRLLRFPHERQAHRLGHIVIGIGTKKENRLNNLDFYYFDKPQVKPQTFLRSINLIEDFPTAREALRAPTSH